MSRTRDMDEWGAWKEVAAPAIHGMHYDRVSLHEALDRVMTMDGSAEPRLVVTPNVDHFLRWQRDDDFRRLYGRAALTVLDGMPLVWMARQAGDVDATRVTGVDLFSAVCREASVLGRPVAIVGGLADAPRRASAALTREFPGLEIAFAEAPSAQQLESNKYVAKLSSKCREYPGLIVAVCLGSPRQERLFASLADEGAQGVFLGVGAAVDFWAGNIKRAPVWMRDGGLEWLHRLASEPKRLWRRYLIDDVAVVPYLLSSLLNRKSE